MSQLQHVTANGYTISVINDGYGGERGLFEVAVWETQNGEFVTRAPFENTVVGWLTKEDVAELVILIEGWEPALRAVNP